jgi:hypothetical protein
MCDDQYNLVAASGAQIREYGMLRFVIQGGRRFVQNQDTATLENRASYGNALLLSSREL